MVQTLRILALLAFLAAAGLITFGYWGTFTDAGNERYPEMGSYIPFAWGLLGVLLLGVSVVLVILAWLCTRLQRPRATTIGTAA